MGVCLRYLLVMGAVYSLLSCISPWREYQKVRRVPQNHVFFFQWSIIFVTVTVNISCKIISSD